jgi:prepilin-type N-terminal cleavage/methylation domain-containing protein
MSTRAIKSRRSTSRGFTLVEILVALLAGLVVALTVMALSREATSTFHEEVRSAAAEAAARTATDRLRADLQRAAFMSTPNINKDPTLASPPGTLYTSRIKVGFKGLRRLAAVRLVDGGSKANTPASALPSNSLNPDMIEIGGNFTSNDHFVVRMVDEPSGNCQRVWLALDSPAIYRLGPTPTIIAQALRQVFQPVPAGGTTQFMARIVDDTMHAQYAVTCAKDDAVGFASGAPYVDLETMDDGYAILNAKATQTVGGATGLGAGRMTINPVQIVRWEITNAPQAQYGAALNSATDPLKYDLVRSYIDAKGDVVPASEEVIAEYAIDLKFAFTVESGSSTATAQQVLAFEDTKNASDWAYDVTTPNTLVNGPQRIRTVRARVVTRAEYPDRASSVAVSPANANGQKYLYRYCAAANDGDCTDGKSQVWARSRTFTTEVSLPNQSRAFF